MSKLDDAFAAFHLEEGTTFAAAKRKYRQFVKCSHPDLMRGAEAKEMAEVYLKNINHLFEILETHFRLEHKSDQGCYHVQKAKAAQEKIARPAKFSNLFPETPASFRTERNTPRPGEPSAAEMMEAAQRRMNKREADALKQRAEADAAERTRRDAQSATRMTQEAARQIFLDRLRRAPKPEDKV